MRINGGRNRERIKRKFEGNLGVKVVSRVDDRKTYNTSAMEEVVQQRLFV